MKQLFTKPLLFVDIQSSTIQAKWPLRKQMWDTGLRSLLTIHHMKAILRHRPVITLNREATPNNKAATPSKLTTTHNKPATLRQSKLNQHISMPPTLLLLCLNPPWQLRNSARANGAPVFVGAAKTAASVSKPEATRADLPKPWCIWSTQW